MNRVFESFHVRNYRIWFAGILVSNVGLWMARVAQDWLVLTDLSDNSGLAVGITSGLQFAPQLLLSPLAGYMADRFSKRRLLLFTQTLLGMTAAVQAVLILAGVVQLWQVYLLATILGVVAAIDAPARQVFVSELVGPEDLTNAVSLNSVSFNSARLIGPAVAGFIIEWVGPGWAFAINALTYAATLVALLTIHTDDLHSLPRAERSHVSVRTGLGYLRTHPNLIAIMVIMFLINLLAMNFPVSMALMARLTFDRGAGDYGLLNSALALGALGGGLYAAASRRPRLSTLLWTTAAFLVSMVLAALAGSYLLFATALVPCGFFMIRLATGANAYVQLNSSPLVRGQVMAIYLAIYLGGSPLGSPFIGWVGDAIGPRATLWLGAFGCLAAIVVGVSWSVLSGYTTLAAVVSEAADTATLHRNSRTAEHLAQPVHPETGPLPVIPDDLPDDEQPR